MHNFQVVTGLIGNKAGALDKAGVELPELTTEDPAESFKKLILLAALCTRHAVALYEDINEHERQVIIGLNMICLEANRGRMEHCGNCSRDVIQEEIAGAFAKEYASL
jgi:hypothetical protein